MRVSGVFCVLILVAACTSGDGESTASQPEMPSPSVSATTLQPVTTTTTGSTDPSTTLAETTTTVSPGGDEPSMVVLGLGPAAVGPIAAAASGDGFPTVAYVSAETDLRVVMCSDVNCEGMVGEVILGYPSEPVDLDLAVGVDGSPVVVVNGADKDGAVVYWCTDPACSSVETIPVVDQDGVGYPTIVVDSGGMASVSYITHGDSAAGEPMKVKVAACKRGSDVCDGWALVDVLPAAVFTGPLSVRLDANDRLFLGYWYSQGYEVQESRVAVCPAPQCGEGNHSTFAFGGGVYPKTTPADGGDRFNVWYQTGSESLPADLITDKAMDEGISAFPAIWSLYSDLMVTTCRLDGCDEAVPVQVGEDWLLPQAAGALRLFNSANGNVGAIFNHASRTEPIPQLHVTKCNDAACSDGTTRALGVDVIDGWFFDVITRPETPPQVVFRSLDGAIGLYSCAADICGP